MKKLLLCLVALPLGMACESDRHREMLETQKILRETQRMIEENERKLKQIEEDRARRVRPIPPEPSSDGRHQCPEVRKCTKTRTGLTRPASN
jgi:hypothetical protein